jgi:outer membrane protein
VNRRLLTASIVVFVMTAGTVFAQTPGSRYGGRVSWVNASATSEELGDTDNTLKLHTGWGVELDALLMFSDRFGVELSVGTSAHRFCITGGDWGEIDAGRVWLVPVNAIAQFHPPVYGQWDPYVGIGVSWVPPIYNGSAELTHAGITSLDLEGGVGVAAQLGVNYQLDHRWYANIDLRYLGTSLDARVRSEEEDFPTVTLDITPFVVSLGFGYKF